MLLLTGSDDYRLTQRKKFYRNAFTAKHPTGEIEYLDNKSTLAKLSELSFTSSLFGGNQLIFLENFWTPEKFEEAVKSKFFDKISELSDITFICIEPSLDKRKKFSKFLIKNAKVETFGDMDEKDLAFWILDFVKKKSGEISFTDAQYLINRVGHNLWTIHHELEKCLMSSEDNKISKILIEELTVPHPQTVIWDFLTKFSSRNSIEAINQWQILLEMGESVHQILAMLIREVRIHTMILSGLGQGLNAKEIAKQTKLHPFVVQKTQKLSQKFTREKLCEIYEDLYKIDRGIKTGKFQSTTDDQSEIELQIEKIIIKL